MLVGPGGAAIVAVDHLENRVHLDEIMRIDRNAVSADQGARQIGRVDLGQRLAQRSAAGIARLVIVDALVEGGLPPWRVLARRVARGEERAIIGDVVEDAMAFRRAAGHLGEQAGEGIRRRRGQRVRIGQAMAGERRQGAVGMGRDIIGEVHGVQAVDADQQHMGVAPLAVLTMAVVRPRGQAGRQGQKADAHSAKRMSQFRHSVISPCAPPRLRRA